MRAAKRMLTWMIHQNFMSFRLHFLVRLELEKSHEKWCKKNTLSACRWSLHFTLFMFGRVRFVKRKR